MKKELLIYRIDREKLIGSFGNESSYLLFLYLNDNRYLEFQVFWRVTYKKITERLINLKIENNKKYYFRSFFCTVKGKLDDGFKNYKLFQKIKLQNRTIFYLIYTSSPPEDYTTEEVIELIKP